MTPLMTGFDPPFLTPEAYIIGITKQIWEDREIASPHRSYAADIPVRSPGSVVCGNHGVIAATLATLAEFPDRILSTATHANAGAIVRQMGWDAKTFAADQLCRTLRQSGE